MSFFLLSHKLIAFLWDLHVTVAASRTIYIIYTREWKVCAVACKARVLNMPQRHFTHKHHSKIATKPLLYCYIILFITVNGTIFISYIYSCIEITRQRHNFPLAVSVFFLASFLLLFFFIACLWLCWCKEHQNASNIYITIYAYACWTHNVLCNIPAVYYYYYYHHAHMNTNAIWDSVIRFFYIYTIIIISIISSYVNLSIAWSLDQMLSVYILNIYNIRV